MIGSMSLRTPLAVLAATACVTGVALAVSDQARSVVDMAPVGVWFANDDADSVSHLGPAGTDATVQIARPNGALRITELDGVAYVTDEDGHLSRIDPAHLVVSQEATLPSSNTQLIGGGGRLYVVDHDAGTVRELDPEGLTTIGETTKIGEQLGAAVVDDAGVLWIPDLTTGSIVAVDGRTVTTNAQVARPGEDVRLSVVNGVVVAINPAASTVTEISGGGSTGATHTVAVTPGASAPAVVGSGSVLPVVSGANLVTLDLRNGRSIRIELAAPDHRLGTPAIAGDRVYVPDFTAGTLLVVDLASRRVVDTLRVTGRAGTFELVVDGGRVFVNDPASERAWTLNSAGALVPVAKYDPSRPGGGTGGGAVPPPPAPTTTTTVPDERDDRKDDDEDDEDDDDDPASSPSTTPGRSPDQPPSTRPPATTPPVVVVPPSTTKQPPATTPPVTVPGSGGQGNDGPPASASSTTTTTTTAPAVSDGGVRDVVAVPGDSEASVAWRPPDGWKQITGYRVVVEPSGVGYDVAAGETRFTASGLRNGTAYVFAITARSAGGDGATVRSVAVTPSAPRPDAPTNVVATAGDATATVTWEAPRRGRVTGYVVDVMFADETQALSPITAAADQRRVTVTGLQNGTRYYVTVRATVDNQTGTPTSSTIFTPVSVPGRPSGVSAAVTAGGQITVAWSAAPDNGLTIASYTVSAPGLASQDVPGDRLSAVFDGLATGATHTFTVVARNSLGTGPGATSGAVVVQSQVPGEPGGVGATAGDGTARVTWSAAPANGSTVAGYRVRNVTDGTAATTVPASQLSQDFNSLANGTAYVFEVQAVATNGAAGPAVRTNTVTPVGPLTSPTGVVATATSPVTASVSFDAAPMLNGNPIQSWVVSTTPATTEQTVTAGSVTIGGLQQNTTYVVHVAAVTTSGVRSAATASAAITTPFGIPDAVTGLRPTREGLNNVTLVWDAMPYAEWYVVEPLGGGDMTPLTVTTNMVTYDPMSYYEDGWQVRVTAYSSYGPSAPSLTWVSMPIDPIDECGGRTRKICP